MSDGRYREDDGRSFDTFKKRFRMLIEGKGINMKDTAVALNMNPTSIGRYFGSRTPDIVAIWRIADFFNVSIDWLLGRDNERYLTLPEKDQLLLNKYKLASENDRLVIDTLLSKYDVL